MFERLLVATDFSKPAFAATNAAEQLARVFGSRVVLMHAYREDQPAQRDRVLEYLRVFREERFGSVESVELVATPESRPDVAVCAEAANDGSDLIVVGRHGEHEKQNRLLGTTTERVVRHAPCSVLVVNPQHRDPMVLTKHILVGCDLSEESEPAIEAAAALARKLDAWVTLLHVFNVMPPLALLREPYEPGADKAFEARAGAKLESLRKQKLLRVPGDTRVMRDKSTVTAICDYAGIEEVDLVVVGTHGLTGIRRLLIGSVAERVVRHCPTSVLVVRP